MRKVLLFGRALSFILFLFPCFLQGQRYVTDLFTEVERKTYLYATVDEVVLFLDFYQGKSDTASQRPLILYVHGGGFSGGRRNDDNLVEFAEELAKKGYTVASISYRLTMKGKGFDCDQTAQNKVKTFQAAVQDIRRAVQFILERKSLLGINSSQVVLAGSSAGAEAILHAAYWDLSDLPPNTVSLPDDFRYAGLISMAGAIVDLKLINEQTAIPSLFFHGTCDNLVPYATAPHHYCHPSTAGYLTLFGSRSIADHLHEIGQPYYLFTSCNGAHEWATYPLTAYRHIILDFLYHDILREAFRQVHEVVSQEGSCDYHEKPFPYCK